MKICVLALVLSPLLALRAQIPASPSTERVAFAQYCFWTGEMELGGIDGVVRTEAGYFQGREVTLVDFDPKRVSLEELAEQARKAGVADQIHPSTAGQIGGPTVGGVKVGPKLDQSYRTAPASDQKKQLEDTPYAKLQLTPEQATKVNAFARKSPAKAQVWLSASQREKLAATR